MLAAAEAVAVKLKPADKPTAESVSPLSKELVVGIVGYAGAGCSTVADKLSAVLEINGYTHHWVKLSSLIEARAPAGRVPAIEAGTKQGATRLARARVLQDVGDDVRQEFGSHAVASLAIKEIIRLRGSHKPGEQRSVFILDSLKHNEEVELLRRVYDKSFRLIAVHCDRTVRESRLIGPATSNAKYRGAESKDVMLYIDRDEKDKTREHGQQVRDAFYLADYFLDNNAKTQDGARLVADLDRFAKLLLGSDMVRPTAAEIGMYHAHSAARQSACLSRQVGAALQSAEGTIVSTGCNEVPKYGGGVYAEGEEPDKRCFKWEWTDGKVSFTGCHNSRRKIWLRSEIAAWLSDNFSKRLAEAAHPVPKEGSDTAAAARVKAETEIKEIFSKNVDDFDRIPGIGDLVEFSRSIHAEMNAVLSACRNGVPATGCTLYCTTFPCHNCARHLITAGISSVLFIEPYVKSLAAELHYDAIQTERDANKQPTRMLIAPFTGVGPRLYEECFTKLGDLKEPSGAYKKPGGTAPAYAVRLRELMTVEEAAASLIP